MSKPTRLHYVLTLQLTDSSAAPTVAAAPGGGSITIKEPNTRLITMDGTVKPAADTTRQQIFYDVLADARKRAGLPEGAPLAVVFWSLEPNKITS